MILYQEEGGGDHEQVFLEMNTSLDGGLQSTAMVVANTTIMPLPSLAVENKIIDDEVSDYDRESRVDLEDRSYSSRGSSQSGSGSSHSGLPKCSQWQCSQWKFS